MNGKAAGPVDSSWRDAMAITIFLGLCVLAEGFLVYVLVQFVREGRRLQAGRRPSSYLCSLAGGRAQVTGRKVSQITIPEGYPGDTQSGQRAS